MQNHHHTCEKRYLSACFEERVISRFEMSNVVCGERGICSSATGMMSGKQHVST